MSYIVPREKPKCYNCPFRTLDYCGLLIEHDCVTVNVNEMTVSEYCPLVEIPTPHGRLGDLDKLWDRMYNYSDNEGAKMPYGDNDFMIHKDSACELIEDAPTIIEGSKT